MANINATPKQRFQESKDNISKHREMVGSREFERGIDFALMEYQRYLSNAVTDASPNTALACCYKSVGANEFIHILKTLGEPPMVAPARPADQLDHKA